MLSDPVTGNLSAIFEVNALKVKVRRLHTGDITSVKRQIQMSDLLSTMEHVIHRKP